MNYKDLFNSKNLFLILLFITTYLRVINIISEQLWEDEAISIAIASAPNNSFWNVIIRDIHPPLYYLILRGWIILFGKSVFSTRLLSVLFSILTFPVLYLIGKEIKDEKLGLIVIFLYSLSPFSIFYANEVRAYSLIHLLFTICLYFAILCIKDPIKLRNYLYLSITGATLIYTHYIGFIYFGILLIGLLIFNRKEKVIYRKVILTILITVASYIPWLPYAVQDFLGGAHGYAGGELNLIYLFYWAFNLFLGPVPSNINDPYVYKIIVLTLLLNIPLMILSIISVIGLIFTYKDIDSFNSKELLFFIIVIPVLLFGITIIIGFIVINSFTAKNLIGVLTPIHILEAIGLYHLFSNKNLIVSNNKILTIIRAHLSKRLLYSIIAVFLITNISIYPLFRAYYLQKPDWDGCIKQLKKKFKNHDIIILCYPGGPYSDVMEYYSDLNNFDLDDNFEEVIYDEDEIEEFFEDITKDNITRIWIITFWESYRDPKDKTDDMIVDEYDLEEIKEYNYRLDITLALYELPS